jgi:hypothetical protein
VPGSKKEAKKAVGKAAGKQKGGAAEKKAAASK